MKLRTLLTLFLLPAALMATATTYAEGEPEFPIKEISIGKLLPTQPTTYTFSTKLAVSAVFSGHVEGGTENVEPTRKNLTAGLYSTGLNQ